MGYITLDYLLKLFKANSGYLALLQEAFWTCRVARACSHSLVVFVLRDSFEVRFPPIWKVDCHLAKTRRIVQSISDWLSPPLWIGSFLQRELVVKDQDQQPILSNFFVILETDQAQWKRDEQKVIHGCLRLYAGQIWSRYGRICSSGPSSFWTWPWRVPQKSRNWPKCHHKRLHQKLLSSDKLGKSHREISYFL